MENFLPYKGKLPAVAEDCFVAENAVLVGDVTIGEGSSVWFGCTLRGDIHYIRIGKCTNIQDGTIIHVDSPRDADMSCGTPTVIGDHVSVGHGCILHACTIEDGCLIGMGAIVMDRAHIGRGSIVGAGSVVLKGTVIPPFSVVLGLPGKVTKVLPEESFADRLDHAKRYCEIANAYK